MDLTMKDNIQFLRELPIYQEEQPYQLYGFPNQDSLARENCEFEAVDVEVIDTREHPVTIQDHGFAFVRFKSACDLNAKHFETVGGDPTTLMQYLEETIGFIRNMFEPLDVVCFDWRFRRRDPKASPGIPPRDLKDIRNFALPSGDVVHCDYSMDGGFDRLKTQLLAHELDDFVKENRMARMVNVWRPLNRVVRNTPLLLCDRCTVPKTDLIEVDTYCRTRWRNPISFSIGTIIAGTPCQPRGTRRWWCFRPGLRNLGVTLRIARHMAPVRHRPITGPTLGRALRFVSS
ncbi:hypothetical protein B0T25DRAFT_61125 [Lasiosphaeria hispida]|uniref:Uncharacterized protein n=1 Tax=Lasiosphaeria hispida TaxID=260671 RepID=A0AAJ0ML15_9PEZI|nr:hypothetical protein B0T25DRAFT_61125 [Lasiosphaeria hispida]